MLDPGLVDRLRAVSPVLIEEIIAETVQAVPRGTETFRRHAETTPALFSEEHRRQLLECLAGSGTSHEERATVYRSLGHSAYLLGIGLDSLQAALRIGTQIAWRRFVEIAGEARTSTEQMCLLTERLLAIGDEVCAHLLAGYTELAGDQADSLPVRRQRLLDAVLSEPPPDDVTGLARAALWRPPRFVACVALDESWATAGRLPPALDGDVLVDLRCPGPCLLLPDPDGPGRVDMLRRNLRGARFAVGPSVLLGKASMSLRLARRGLDLMRRGHLPGRDQIRCADHLPALLVAGDEDVARQLVERHLAVFDRLRPQQRETLRETLLTLLMVGGSYPEIAARLSVHPQTVRYRMRRLEELFGDRLKDPEWRYEMLLALHAVQLLPGADPGTDAGQEVRPLPGDDGRFEAGSGTRAASAAGRAGNGLGGVPFNS